VNDTWLGIVLTVIDGRAHQFSVRAQNPTATTSDPLDRIGREYLFDDARQTDPSKKVGFVLKVTPKLMSGWSDTNEQGLNDATIRFGLECIRSEPKQTEFLYTVDEHKRMLALPGLEGSALRLAILKLIYSVNELWPNESVSVVDLADNLVADKEQLQSWLNSLQEEGLVGATSGSKDHRARGKGGMTAFRLSSKARKQVAEEIKQSTPGIQRHAGEKPLVFLSYSTRDKRLAGEIKRGLVDCDLDVFMAHEDLTPSALWVEEILRNINNCDAFVPILAEHFRGSMWTDQESGQALAKGKLIIPLMFSDSPHGFLGRFQAKKVDVDNLLPCCQTIAEIIGKHLKAENSA